MNNIMELMYPQYDKLDHFYYSRIGSPHKLYLTIVTSKQLGTLDHIKNIFEW